MIRHTLLLGVALFSMAAQGQEVTLQILDKVIGKAYQVTLKEQQWQQVGALQIRARQCIRYPRPTPQEAVFLEIKDSSSDSMLGERWFFTQLTTTFFDHSVYDIRPLSCKTSSP